MKTKEQRTNINMILLVLTLLVLVSFSSAAVVSHSPAQVTPGTFASGNYIFPDNLSINGNVGINGNNPTAAFEVYQDTDDATEGIHLTRSGIDTGGIWLDASTNTLNMGRQFAGNSAIAIDNSLNVGIGTADPTSILDVGNADNDNYITLERNGNSNGGIRWYRPAGPAVDAQIYVNSQENLIINNSFGDPIALIGGNVGIGTTSPSYSLDVVGDSKIGDISYSYETTTISSTNYHTLTHTDGTSLNTGYQYKINLMIGGTGTLTGTTHLVWHDGTSWNIRDVSMTGTGSNRPELFLDSGVVKARTQHSSDYPVYMITEAKKTYSTNNQAHIWGADYTWQRSGDVIYYTDGGVNIGGTADPGTDNLIVDNAVTAFTVKIDTTSSSTNSMLFLDSDSAEWRVQSAGSGGSQPGAFSIRNTVFGTPFLIEETTGDIGIGTTGPRNRLEVYTDDATNYAARIHNDGNNNNRYGLHIQAGTDDNSGTNYMVSFRDGDGNTVGTVTSTGGSAYYNPFTGAHVATIENASGYEYGDVLCIDSTYEYEEKPRQVLYSVSLCKTQNDKSVLGVYASEYDSQDNSTDRPLYLVNAVGDGHIRVSNATGNIEIGDYLTSSPIDGLAMKQDDNMLRSYTIAKATQKVDWSKEENSTKLISCTYHGG